MIQITAEKEYVFEGDQQTFRSSHASTLAALPSGEVLAAWFAGKHEKSSDVAIWMARRSGDGWAAPVKIADEAGIAHWNPVLYAEGDSILLFYKVGHEITDWFTRIMRSGDGGRTWTDPIELVKGDIGGRGPVRNKPILLSNGTLAAPASVEKNDADAPGKQIWESFVDITVDNGRTWKRSEIVPMDAAGFVGTEHWFAKGLIQPTLWTSGNERVYMLLRSTEGRIYRSDSEDYGRTWCRAYPTQLPNNNSGIDAVLMNNGLLALVFNPVSGYSTESPRTPLIVAFSSDNGITWGNEFVLEDQAGEYSYPAIVAAGDVLYITYTWKRESIAFWKLAVTP
ncbi:exo-alpha-sialidase [Paenibacillus solisilvae]|uniref:Exo-alpha-sialidase n=1 Tax=Paenibacillus solisilvae TaxID=2486751 RepID=A0ABW0W5U2_9BACL